MSGTMFLVLGYCGDYYCEEEHPVALARTREEAEELAARHEEVRLVAVTRGERSDLGPLYKKVSDIIEVPVAGFARQEKVI